MRGAWGFNEIAEVLPKVHFIWIGDGELRDNLNSDNIEITGWLERKQALSVAMSADVFMLTSLWEGLPMSLLEAMYMKKVCIVSDVIGNHDVIQDRVNGYVCQNVDQYVNAIQHVENGENKELVEKAYADILSKYDTALMSDKYSRFYMEAIEEAEKVKHAHLSLMKESTT